MSVWVEIFCFYRKSCSAYVTLHVSVWVEMTETEETPTEEEVTLHVSVWVEILGLQRFNYHFVSRSTWACELKLSLEYNPIENYSSRSTWACELKYKRNALHLTSWMSRSTWACELKFISLLPFNGNIVSRSTWACELKYLMQKSRSQQYSHAPRERVSWNRSSRKQNGKLVVTLHVSVWVEIKFFGVYISEQTVTLHVSVWVEILCSISDTSEK